MYCIVLYCNNNSGIFETSESRYIKNACQMSDAHASLMITDKNVKISRPVAGRRGSGTDLYKYWTADTCNEGEAGYWYPDINIRGYETSPTRSVTSYLYGFKR